MTVASGSAKAGKGGAARVRVVFTAKARKRLAKQRRVPVTLRVTGAKDRALTLRR